MKRLTNVVAVAAVLAGVAAPDAGAALVSGYEIRPGVPALQFTADAGEANNVTLSSSTNVDAGPFVGARAVTIADAGAELRVSGPYPCRLITPHLVRCRLAAPSTWAKVSVDLGDGSNRLRMTARPFGPYASVSAQSAGNVFTVRGPNTTVYAGTGDRVRFLPPGGGGVIVGGSPRIWLVDGAAEFVDCRTPGSPRIFTDPFDQIGYYCSV